MPDLPAVPVKSEAPSTQPTPSAPTTKPSTSSNSQASSQDSVTLSSTALDMSKALNQQHEQKAEVKQEVARQKEAVDTEGKKSYKAMTKAYPPYMGNSEELKLLKESSPALYREILRMIVPPPLNISYADKQMLQSSRGFASSTQTVSTTA
jgi:hypothetical protein